MQKQQNILIGAAMLMLVLGAAGVAGEPPREDAVLTFYHASGYASMAFFFPQTHVLPPGSYTLHGTIEALAWDGCAGNDGRVCGSWTFVGARVQATCAWDTGGPDYGEVFSVIVENEDLAVETDDCSGSISGSIICDLEADIATDSGISGRLISSIAPCTSN